MQIDITEVEIKKFNPINVNIVLESLDELDTLIAVFNTSSHSVAENFILTSIISDRSPDMNTISNILGRLYNQLINMRKVIK